MGMNLAHKKVKSKTKTFLNKKKCLLRFVALSCFQVPAALLESLCHKFQRTWPTILYANFATCLTMCIFSDSVSLVNTASTTETWSTR